MTETSLRQNTYNGFEVGLSARLPRRTLVFGGWSLERTVDVDCTMNTANASATLNSPNTLRFCDQSGALYQDLGRSADIPYQHGFKLNGNLPLWYGFEISGSLQSYPGAIKATTGGVSWTINRGTTRYPADCTVAGCTPGAIVLPSRFAGDPRRHAAAGVARHALRAALEPARFRRAANLPAAPRRDAAGTGRSVQRAECEPGADRRHVAEHDGRAVPVGRSQRRRHADIDPAAAHHPAGGAVSVLRKSELKSEV